MSKVSEKNTKAQILDYVKELEEKLAKKMEARKTTADVQKENEIKEVKKAAEELVNTGIVNEETVEKYNNLLETIKMLDKELEEVYQIQRTANTLEALMIAHEDKKEALENEYALKEKELKEKFVNDKATAEKAITDLKNEHIKSIAELNAAYKEEKAKLEKERQREEEEYAYDLKRKREKEDDEWEDLKNQREKELKDKELAVVEREAVANEAIAEKVELLSKIELLSNRIDEVKVEAYDEGKKKEAQSNAIARSYMEKEHKIAIERKDDKISALEKALEESKQAHEADKAKLDAAYTRIQEMAIEAAKNSGVRMMDSTNK